jgi:hypothetical protein
MDNRPQEIADQNAEIEDSRFQHTNCNLQLEVRHLQSEIHNL